MSALEQIIIDKVHQLDEQQQQQVLNFLESLEKPGFDYEQWWQQVEEFQKALREKYGEDYSVGVQDLLDEVREEASWPRW